MLQNESFKKLYSVATGIKQSGSYEKITNSGIGLKAGSGSLKNGIASLKSNMSSVEQISTGMQQLNSATNK